MRASACADPRGPDREPPGTPRASPHLWPNLLQHSRGRATLERDQPDGGVHPVVPDRANSRGGQRRFRPRVQGPAPAPGRDHQIRALRGQIQFPRGASGEGGVVSPPGQQILDQRVAAAFVSAHLFQFGVAVGGDQRRGQPVDHRPHHGSGLADLLRPNAVGRISELGLVQQRLPDDAAAEPEGAQHRLHGHPCSARCLPIAAATSSCSDHWFPRRADPGSASDTGGTRRADPRAAPRCNRSTPGCR